MIISATETLVWNFILRYWQEHEVVPTTYEIAAACYVSRSHASRCLNKLAKAGQVVFKGKGRHRNYVLPKAYR